MVSSSCILIKNDRTKINYWQSSRAPCRSSSTEESELLALDLALRYILKLKEIVFQLLRKNFSVVFFINNQTFWCNLMNYKTTCLPKVILSCRWYIHSGTIANTSLLAGEHNPTNSFTILKPDKTYHLLSRPICYALQHEEYSCYKIQHIALWTLFLLHWCQW